VAEWGAITGERIGYDRSFDEARIAEIRRWEGGAVATADYAHGSTDVFTVVDSR
jgi:hypothetical protein